MSDDQTERRLADIAEAISAIDAHLKRGEISDGLIFDAVRIRLVEIGEAVKALPENVTGAEPSIPWSQIARMRDHLAHRYFDTSHAIVAPAKPDPGAPVPEPRGHPTYGARAGSQGRQGEKQCSRESCGLPAD